MNLHWDIISAIFQIAILYQVFYLILKRAWGTRLGQALMGVGVLAVVTILFTYLLHFDVLAKILEMLLIYLAISSVVIFQQEIRHALTMVGALKFMDRPNYMPDGAATIEFTVKTILELAEQRVGALFAFERGISLKGYERSGVVTNATISKELITCIFTPPLPLHDGGVIVRNGKLAAAHCVFPVSHNPELITRGMRHRAGVGLSEETDAIIVIVSEETGSVSVARNGRLYRYNLSEAKMPLTHWISIAMPAYKPRETVFDKLCRKIIDIIKQEVKE